MASVTNNPDNNFITVSGFTSEEFLQTVIDHALEGYTIVNGTAFLFGVSKLVDMYRPKVEVEDLPVNLEEDLPVALKLLPEVVEGTSKGVEPPTWDEVKEVIGTFDNDKMKLEDYGKTLGIDLRRNKSFSNMTKSLKDFLGV